MNVSDVHVSDEDGNMSRNMTIRANLDARFPRLASKIELQECDYNEKSQQNLPLEFYTRNVPDEMRTSWKLFDVTKFQEEIKVVQKTAVTPQVQREAKNSQQGPEHIGAGPRADRSSVAGCNDADFEQTAAQSPGKMLQNLEPTADELANDIAKQVTMTRKRESHQNT